MGKCPIAWLGGIQVAKRETRHGGRHDRKGPTSLARPTISDSAPPPLKVEWQGGSGMHPQP
jgi:hypothetical protein